MVAFVAAAPADFAGQVVQYYVVDVESKYADAYDPCSYLQLLTYGAIPIAVDVAEKLAYVDQLAIKDLVVFVDVEACMKAANIQYYYWVHSKAA